MFSGIVEEVGSLRRLRRRGDFWEVGVESKKVIAEVNPGDSIAVDGVCLTLKEKTSNLLCFDLMEPTFLNTRFKQLKVNQLVNLEKALELGGTLSGHMVLGHIDCVLPVHRVEKGRDTSRIYFKIPERFKSLVVDKGSIAINGVSLTIQEVRSDLICLACIPYTLQNTNLKYLKVGEKVNVEFDILGKYVLHCLKNVKT